MNNNDYSRISMDVEADVEYHKSLRREGNDNVVAGGTDSPFCLFFLFSPVALSCSTRQALALPCSCSSGRAHMH